MAEENNENKAALDRRRILWQITIFMLAFVINSIVSFRDYFVTDI